MNVLFSVDSEIDERRPSTGNEDDDLEAELNAENALNSPLFNGDIGWNVESPDQQTESPEQRPESVHRRRQARRSSHFL